MRLALAATVLLAAAGSGQAADAASECASAALADYSRQSLALLQAVPLDSLPSVEAVIARRRLQEGYCLRSTHCFYDETLNSAGDLAFRAEFAKCLDEEAEQGK